MTYTQAFLPRGLGGGGGDFEFHRLALPDASFGIQDKVHFRSLDDTAWKILSQTVPAVPEVPAALTHASLTGARSGYNLLNPGRHDFTPTVTTVGYIYFNTVTDRFRKLDTGGERLNAGQNSFTIGSGTTINGKTYYGDFAGNVAALAAGFPADGLTDWYYNTTSDRIIYVTGSDPNFQIDDLPSSLHESYFGANFRWLGANEGLVGSSGVMSVGTAIAYFEDNPPESGLEYYFFSESTGVLFRIEYVPANQWEDVSLDWVLDNANALFLGANGVETTEDIDTPAGVEDYLNTEDNYDPTKTYVFHNNENASPQTGGSSRFTSTQSSSYQGEHNNATRPLPATLQANDWIYNTDASQLNYILDIGGGKLWAQISTNDLLDGFFPSVGYSWAGRNASGPYAQDHTYTTTEILQAIADENIGYDSNSPLVFYDTTNNQLRYVSSYVAPNYGRVDEVTAFTKSVPEVPAYERPVWDEVLETAVGSVAQTESEIRTLLGFTVAEQSDTIQDVDLSGSTLTFRQEDGTTIPITLPSTVDGVVESASFDADSSMLTLVRSGTLTDLEIDLSSLVDEFEDDRGVVYVGPGNVVGTNVIGLTIDGVTAYENGYGVAFVAENTNSSSMALRIGSLSNQSLRDINGNNIPVGAVRAGRLIIAFYDGSQNRWRSNVFAGVDISGKVDVDMQNIASLTGPQSEAARASIGAATNQLATTTVAGLMPSVLVQKLNSIEQGATADQTAAEVRALLGFTLAEQQDTITGLSLSGSILTATHEDGSTTQLTLPSTPGTTDGVVTGVSFNTTTRVVTLTRSGGLDPLTLDLSSLQDEFAGSEIHFISDPDDISGQNAITITIDGVSSYQDGFGVAFIAKSSNVGVVTIGLNSLSHRIARRNDNTAFVTGDITVGKLVIAFYNGEANRWQTTVRPQIDISSKANTDFGNLDTDLTTLEQQEIQRRLDVPNTQFAGPTNAGLMPSNLYNKLAAIEAGATADQTATEIRNLLAFTAAEQADTITDVSLTGNVLTFTQEDGNTFTLTLPTTTATADGVVNSATFNSATRILTLGRTGTLENIPVDLSSLASTEGIIFVDEDDVTAAGDGITLTIAGITAYSEGIVVAFRYPVSNTAGVAIRINALDYRIATRRDNGFFIGNEITQNQLVFAVYDDDDNTWRTNVDVSLLVKLERDLSNVLDPVLESDAKTFRERIRAPRVTTGAAFPSSPSLGDIHTFDATATGLSAVNNAHSAILTTANIGDVFKFTTVGLVNTEDRWVLEVGGDARIPNDAVTTPTIIDGAVTEAKLASGIGITLQILPTSRSESITLQGSGSLTAPAHSSALLAAATSPITVEFGEGPAEMLSATAGGSEFTALQAGVHHIDWEGEMDVAVARPIPIPEVYNSADTIGADEPLVRLIGAYHRATGTNEVIGASGHIIIPADNTVVKFAVTTVPSLTGASSPIYTINAGHKVFFSRGAAGGLSEPEIEDFITEHIRHTIRRRNIVGAGVLQVGDVRFDATSIVLNVHNDLADEWLGDLPVGAEIRMHGLTSAARSSYTLVSVVESGDDATLTVTRDSHSGIFAHNETVVIAFDQEHDPQADWGEMDSNRPSYIKRKPTFGLGRTFYWLHGQTERIGTIVTASQIGIGNRRARFDETQREESNGGIGTGVIGFIAAGDVNANADIVITGEVFEDHQFFTVNGTIDLLFQAHTRADDDETFVARLVKVRAGDDDILLQEATSSAKARQVDPTPADATVFPSSSIGNTIELEYKSLTSDGTDQFSIQLLGFNELEESGIQGHIMMENV